MIDGQCMCGSVQFCFKLPYALINRCYCSCCRKASGSEFGVYVHVSLKQFQWKQGEKNIIHYQPKQGDPRPFCQDCGSRVPLVEVEDNNVIVPAGLVDDAKVDTVNINIFTGSKASWSDAMGKALCVEGAPSACDIETFIKQK